MANSNDELCQAASCPAADEVGGHSVGIAVFPADNAPQVDCVGWD